MTTSRMLIVFICIFLAACAVQFSQGDVAWSQWSSWSDCSTTCGKGIITMNRECLDGTMVVEKRLCGLKSSVKKKYCPNPKSCPVDGKWNEWSEWTDCSVTCDEGTQLRERKCDNPKPEFGGKPCEGINHETKTCLTGVECARDGGWSPWSQWTPCSATCGHGSQRRQRECNNPAPFGDGKPCAGHPGDSRSCNTGVECPVDGEWSEWSDWSPCTITCGTGQVHRKRKCNNPAPRFGGKDCEGQKEETKICRHHKECPVNGKWSEWGPYTRCASTCMPQEKAFQYRTRSCNNPRPKFGGRMCQGSFVDAGRCPKSTNCPVDGDFGEWEPWECLDGLAKRKRECNDPPPQNGGKECPREAAMESFERENDPQKYKQICGDAPPVTDEPDPDYPEEKDGDYDDWENYMNE